MKQFWLIRGLQAVSFFLMDLLGVKQFANSRLLCFPPLLKDKETDRILLPPAKHILCRAVRTAAIASFATDR